MKHNYFPTDPIRAYKVQNVLSACKDIYDGIIGFSTYSKINE